IAPASDPPGNVDSYDVGPRQRPTHVAVVEAPVDEEASAAHVRCQLEEWRKAVGLSDRHFLHDLIAEGLMGSGPYLDHGESVVRRRAYLRLTTGASRKGKPEDHTHDRPHTAPCVTQQSRRVTQRSHDTTTGRQKKAPRCCEAPDFLGRRRR